MPIYEYSCGRCSKVIEALQKFNDAPLKTCPDCGSPVEKLISRTSFQLKGSGWFATDYKKTKPPSPANSDSAASSSTAPASPDKKTGSEKKE